MNLFVTGGTGFIGSHFLKAALTAGHNVIALRRPGAITRIPIPQQPTWVEGSLGEPHATWLNGVDVLVHLAAHSANVPYDSLENCLHWNVIEPVKLFTAARNHGVKRFIVAGSCFEYGRSALRYDFIPPNAPLEPTDTYPASKAAASMAFLGWAAKCRTELAILRIFHVFGEGELESRFWPSLRQAALQGRDFPMSPGEQVRDFIPVELVAQQLLDSLNASIVPGEALVRNVGTGNPQTLRAFAQFWWNHWNAQGELGIGDLPYRENEIMRYVPQV